MQLLVESLLSSIPELASVVALLGFVFFMFGILGMQLWQGTLHYRCRMTPMPVALPTNMSYPGGYMQMTVDAAGGDAA